MANNICKFCGEPIEWIREDDGRWVPMTASGAEKGQKHMCRKRTAPPPLESAAASTTSRVEMVATPRTLLVTILVAAKLNSDHPVPDDVAIAKACELVDKIFNATTNKATQPKLPF
jgi:hypothetical protein